MTVPHSSLINDPLNAALHNLHSPGYIRANAAARAAVTTMQEGDVLYQQDNKNYYYWNGTSWINLGSGSGSLNGFTVIVSKLGSDLNPTGPFLTINAAATYADSLVPTSTQHVAIYILPGQYNESLDLSILTNGKYIDIIGLDTESCIMYNTTGPVLKINNASSENKILNLTIQYTGTTLTDSAVYAFGTSAFTTTSDGFGGKQIITPSVVFNNCKILSSQSCFSFFQAEIRNSYIESTATNGETLVQDFWKGVVQNCQIKWMTSGGSAKGFVFKKVSQIGTLGNIKNTTIETATQTSFGCSAWEDDIFLNVINSYVRVDGAITCSPNATGDSYFEDCILETTGVATYSDGSIMGPITGLMFKCLVFNSSANITIGSAGGSGSITEIIDTTIYQENTSVVINGFYSPFTNVYSYLINVTLVNAPSSAFSTVGGPAYVRNLKSNSPAQVTDHNTQPNGVYFYPYLNNSFSNGLTATGSNQGNALKLTSQINEVTSTPASTGVILPLTSGGSKVTVVNYGGLALNVYPPSGGQINGLGANNPYSLSNNTKSTFDSVSATQWYI